MVTLRTPLANAFSVRKGLCALPGSTPSTNSLVLSLLLEDYKKHHCFFSPIGFHNHLNHRLLAVYDLGATDELIRYVYDYDKKVQRPIDLNGEATPAPGHITDKNWTEFLAKPGAYNAYHTFFTKEVQALGGAKAIQKYIFDQDEHMLRRFVGGALHPMIQAGYGVEFGADFIVAEGLAQSAVHGDGLDYLFGDDDGPNGDLSVFEVFKEVYDSDTLIPPLPYDRGALISARAAAFRSDNDARPKALKAIVKKWHMSEDINDNIRECVFLAALLLGAVSKPGYKPRVDFFLMHITTSSHFLRPIIDILENRKHKEALLTAWLRASLAIVMLRGRPRINPGLLMSYRIPTPPASVEAHPSALVPKYVSPWHPILEDSMHHGEMHVIKAIRALYHAATLYGDTPPGSVDPPRPETHVPGAPETHPGISQADGSIFIRTAGVVMDCMGWVTHGQQAKDWDRSALGWDDAWKVEKEEVFHGFDALINRTIPPVS